jgi:hypothetical protein
MKELQSSWKLSLQTLQLFVRKSLFNEVHYFFHQSNGTGYIR